MKPNFTTMKSTIKLLTALLLAPLAALHAAAAPTPPGDRKLPINQVYPPEAFYHNGKGGRVLDVTKPPFNAKGDGKTDDTKALCAAMRFVFDNTDIPKGDCNPSLKQSWTIYLPSGVYLVSDTVSQGWPARGFLVVNNDWRNVVRLAVDSPDDPQVRIEDNWNIRIVGQDREKTIIRLKDKSPGFGEGAAKAVVQNYILRFSNASAARGR